VKPTLLLGAILITISLAGCAASEPLASPAPSLPVDLEPMPSVPVGSPPATDPPPATQSPESVGIWRSAAPMNVGRIGFDAVVLGDGSILAVGDDHDCIPGAAETGSERAEVYEPDDDRWVEVESLNKPRKLPATVGLADGSAMVIGGINSDDISFSSTKIFSPTARKWADGPLLEVARNQPSAAVLGDGQVLVASDMSDERSSITTSELYDPAASLWARGPSLSATSLYDLHTLANGRVLGIGYNYTDSEPVLVALVFDPSRDAWVGIQAPGTGLGFELVALADGGALAIGGYDGGELYGGDGSLVDRVQRLDRTSGRWSEVAPLSAARAGTTSVRLADGRILVAGGFVGDGFSNGQALGAVEVFDPGPGRWSSMPDLLEPRYDAKAVVLGDGSVLIMGGYADFNIHGDTPWCGTPLTSVERFTPPSP
jgi:hypothetical protein